MPLIDLKLLYKLITPKIDLGEIMKISDPPQGVSKLYVLRGMIQYYGKHYWAYFYSEKYDAWFQFDDEYLRKVGTFQQVIDKSMAGRAIPRTLFYERADVLSKILLDQGQGFDKIYYSDTII